MKKMILCVLLRSLKLGSAVVGVVGAVVGVRLEPAQAQDSVPNAFAVVGSDFSCDFQPVNSRLECKSFKERNLDGVETVLLQDPDRLVLDIPEVVAGKPQSVMVNSSLVARIRSAQRGTAARVVLDLRRPVTFVRHYSSTGSPVISFELSPVASEPLAPTAMAMPPVVSEGVAKDAVELTTAPQPTRETQRPQVANEEIAPQLPRVDLSIPRQALEAESVLLFSVNTTFLSFEPGERPVKDVQVVNKTDKELFLRTDVQRVHDSGAPTERYENTKVVVASPKRFSLPPLATRSVRLVVSGELPESGEEVYRMILSPEELPEAQVEVQGELNQQTARFKVVAGLGVTISLPSAQAQGVLRIEPQANQVMLINTGTRSVFVENCSACPLNKDTCASSGRKLLYPQRPWSMPVSGSGVINCDVVIGKDRNQLSSLYSAKESK
jgi:hypothetical protein